MFYNYAVIKIHCQDVQINSQDFSLLFIYSVYKYIDTNHFENTWVTWYNFMFCLYLPKFILDM